MDIDSDGSDRFGSTGSSDGLSDEISDTTNEVDFTFKSNISGENLQFNGNNTDFNTSMEEQHPPHYLNITTEYPIEYAVPLYGYCMPFLFLITITANTLIVVVLSKRHMRTPTNAVLLAMALADMFTVLFPAPWLLYMYTFGNHYKPFYPAMACYAWSYMNEVIPNLFHTASIWLTLALAVQRYIYVCHAPVARIWCTMPMTIKGITWIFIFAAIHQSTRLFDRMYNLLEITWEGDKYFVCQMYHAPWVDWLTLDVYYNVYFWFRVLFVHLFPCISLIILNLLLFRAMRKAQLTREKLFKDNKKSNECKKLRDSNSTTIMLIVVVTVFLLVEIPLAVLTILHIISSTMTEFLDYEITNVLIIFSNFFIIVSYPINFAIYCGMSRQFRETFKDLFIRGSATRVDYSSRYSIVNGPRTCTNETNL